MGQHSLSRSEINHLKVTEELGMEKVEDLNTLNWKTFTNISSLPLIDKILSDVKIYLKQYPKETFKFIVGCDSQRHGSKLIYVTSIIFQRVGYGGNVYYLREIESIFDYLKNTIGKNEQRAEKLRSLVPVRLWKETTKAIHCAQWLDNNVLNKINMKVSEIHADLNKKSIFKSSEQLKPITGYIIASGYKAVVKPDSWGASDIANQKTK